MPDTLNKQAIINLLIDSPLREPIKINLIDIVNNTSEPDLPKVYSTITKELEIFQKATERRMKLADETIAKLGGTAPSAPSTPSPTTPTPTPTPTMPTTPPPLDLPPLPTPPSSPAPVATPAPSTPPLSVPPLDLPPLPTANPAPSASSPAPEPEIPVAAPAPVSTPPLEPLGAPVTSASSDEDALAEIQKELDSLKSEAAADVASAAAPVATPAPAK